MLLKGNTLKNNHSIATIINYCSNDINFIFHCIEQAKKFSKKIIIPICDHFFDGTKERYKDLEKVFSNTSDCDFLLYPYEPSFVPKKIINSVGENNFWHSFSRYLGYLHTDKSIEYILFLDADEIVDANNFNAWLDNKEYEKFDVLKLANYWYFRSCDNQALQWEDSIVLAKREILTKDILLQKEERNAIYDMHKKNKKRNVLGLDDMPMVHHYSWVRSKDEMLKKVRSWGHKDDKNWEELVEKEFENEPSKKDFIHGYEYIKVKPYINLTDFKGIQNKNSNVKKISKEEIKLSLKERFLLRGLWQIIFSKRPRNSV